MISILIALSILAIAHLSVDKDFPESVKGVAVTIFIILGGIYLVFGLIL